MFARLSRMASGSSQPPPREEEQVEQVSLSELNELLDALAGAFPAHDAVLLRELLLQASHESRLHVAANALLQDPQRYADKQTRPLAPPAGRVAEWEKFRSTEYKKTVKQLLAAEYQSLARSTVRNVLAENNYDYARSRDALAHIASKSWRYSLAAWISRKIAPRPSPRPDSLKGSTGCSRLDDELHALGQPERDAQSVRDAQLARQFNEDEYAEARALLECECCFGDFAWEDITTCTNGHFFCRACLDRSVKEALYGQGSCLSTARASVCCISSVAAPACDGVVALALLPHALPAETLAKLEQRFAHEQLQATGLQLVRCPACPYAAVDSAPAARLRLSAKVALLLVVQLAGLWLRHPLAMLEASAYLWCSLPLLCCTLASTRELRAELRACVREATTRVRRRKTGARQLFTCENPRCGMESCIDCGRPWAAFHDCRREDTERLYVERAMSEAVKRTCPQCHTSFVKTDGCNKLTCPCGYEMCYLCRADVRGVRYRHFCQHPRAVPGTACAECDKCNLYESEDEQAVAAAAARRAADEWALDGRDGLGNTRTRRTPRNGRSWWPWAEQQVEHLIELLFEW